MTINFDAARTAAAATLKPERREAAARQDRWMLEMEKALVGERPAPPRQERHSAGPAAYPRLPEAPQAASPAAPASVSAPAPQPAHAPAAAETATQRAAAASTRSQAADTSPPADADAEETSERERKQVAAAMPAAAPVATTAPAVAPSPADTATAALTTASAVPAPAPVAAAVGDRAAVSTTQQPAYAATKIGAPVTLMSADVSLASAATEIEQGELETPPAQDAPDHGAQGQAFDKRAMRVFVSDNQVHAFIRDAQLRHAHLGSVAQALASEMAAGGKQLATLTVNGKLVDARASAASADEDDTFSQHDEPGGHAAPLPYVTSPSYKGNP